MFMQWLRSTFGAVITCAYFLPNLHSWVQKEKIRNTKELRTALEKVFWDPSVLSLIMVSTEKESPTKPPQDDYASEGSSALSDLTNDTSSSRGSVQGNFHERVLRRDGAKCVFCFDATKAHLKAAHIFDVFRGKEIPMDDAGYLEQYGILDTYGHI